MWYAKPSGFFGYATEEGKANIYEMYWWFLGKNYSLESITGIIANSVAESGLNPWRWQGDKFNLGGGYGLFQYTPASEYINGAKNVEYYSPNLSVTQVTSGASVYDGIAQMDVFHNNTLSKWTTYCWRKYWDKNTYADLYATRNEILTKYGNGTGLTMEQFANIDDIYYATFAFLACFEGPAKPNASIRYEYAQDIYTILTGDIPPPEPEPEPPEPEPEPPHKKHRMPVWMYLHY